MAFTKCGSGPLLPIQEEGGLPRNSAPLKVHVPRLSRLSDLIHDQRANNAGNESKLHLTGTAPATYHHPLGTGVYLRPLSFVLLKSVRALPIRPRPLATGFETSSQRRSNSLPALLCCSQSPSPRLSQASRSSPAPGESDHAVCECCAGGQWADLRFEIQTGLSSSTDFINILHLQPQTSQYASTDIHNPGPVPGNAFALRPAAFV